MLSSIRVIFGFYDVRTGPSADGQLVLLVVLSLVETSDHQRRRDGIATRRGGFSDDRQKETDGTPATTSKRDPDRFLATPSRPPRQIQDFILRHAAELELVDSVVDKFAGGWDDCQTAGKAQARFPSKRNASDCVWVETGLQLAMANPMNSIIVLQKKAVRIIAKADFLAHSTPLFKSITY